MRTDRTVTRMSSDRIAMRPLKTLPFPVVGNEGIEVPYFSELATYTEVLFLIHTNLLLTAIFFAILGQSTCSSCPSGTYTSTTGNTASTDCSKYKQTQTNTMPVYEDQN